MCADAMMAAGGPSPRWQERLQAVRAAAHAAAPRDISDAQWAHAGAGGLFYYSSASGNTCRFVARLGLDAQRIPVSPKEAMPEPAGPFVLICPTYADGDGRGAVARQVIRFLNDPARRALLRGVIASGNRNFGRLFACAGPLIAGKCRVPVLYRFELAGTDADVARVRAGLARFWEVCHA